ncbi:MAG TPA: tetratricopeptide repeat protein [Anaeromyxobacteraceae bacterium]|nr:tetratricopeptide repeat protein [Anaeromyxobacteraceae bacterium]
MLALRALVFLALAAATGLAASRLPQVGETPYDVEAVPRAGVLGWMFLGNRTLAANLNWLRAVQYIGEPRANERGWDKLFPLVDVVTDLDPGHGYAYQVAGTILGSVGRVSESNRILEKGTREVPNRYILPYLRAFNAFYYDGDWTTAGHFAEVAARTPGAPEHVRQNVLAYYVKGRRADAAIAFLERSLEEAKDPDTRKAVESQLRQAFVERDAAQLDDAVAAWRRRYFIGPLAVEQLVTAGLLETLPPDPAGGRWYVDADGRVHSTANPFRFAKPDPNRPREPGVNPAAYGGLAR